MLKCENYAVRFIYSCEKRRLYQSYQTWDLSCRWRSGKLNRLSVEKISFIMIRFFFLTIEVFVNWNFFLTWCSCENIFHPIGKNRYKKGSTVTKINSLMNSKIIHEMRMTWKNFSLECLKNEFARTKGFKIIEVENSWLSSDCSLKKLMSSSFK